MEVERVLDSARLALYAKNSKATRESMLFDLMGKGRVCLCSAHDKVAVGPSG